MRIFALYNSQVVLGQRRSSLQGTIHRRTALAVGMTIVAVGLVACSVAAALWDRWPGDLDGMRLTQGLQTGITEPLAAAVTVLGSAAGVAISVIAAGVWLFFIRRRPRLAALLVAVVTLETALVWFLKWAVHRPRPELPSDLEALASSGYSFPSGHVAFVVLFFGALAYLLARHWGGVEWHRRALVAMMLAPVVLIGPSRVAWGVHWPSDVLGGYLVALLGILALVVLHGRFRDVAE